MKVIIAVFLIFIFPVIALASGQAHESVSTDFTSSVYGYLGLILFIVAYSLVIFENEIHLRKSKPVVLAAGIIWVLVALAYIRYR